ncbi:uncharacterized protein PHACADRAFT_150994 [Phanerochaete carnosa HHB-10118-sp]|uniref:F-box domain-containing protein n=1 Tax=Phanerochaete carnosa (strain HHB-10118-sp) TaxID=650164 RepID=K5UQF0_PHACS|nr:uncharacterized protein PHACADRAFT_150994 [Phanerochaete carnosa HHB-10118-sp]EKM52056.1 hypothetical protein PHACADRAFT_150994 [Phanerochaete carnosa HHB-10118-sp]
MSTDSLPIELVIKVVKSAYGGVDGQTLASCVLVCKTWRAVSRPYIFECVKISSNERLIALEDLVEHDDAVGPYIRTLIVRPSVELATVPSPWVSKFAKRLPAKLTRLQAIKLICIFDLGDAFEHGLVNEFSKFTPVDRLIFDQCALNLTLVYPLAAALPRLRHLHLGIIMPIPYVLPNLPEQLHPLRLTSAGLDVGDIYPYGLRELVSEVQAPLRSITLGVLNVADADTLPSLAPLAAVINNDLMSTLQEERLLYTGPVPERVVLQKLQRDLPDIHARGVLSVERV